MTFTWKDYANDCQRREMTLEAVEFVRRFALHVLPRGLVRIRHYGLLTHRGRGERLAHCRDLIAANAAATAPATAATTTAPVAPVVATATPSTATTAPSTVESARTPVMIEVLSPRAYLMLALLSLLTAGTITIDLLAAIVSAWSAVEDGRLCPRCGGACELIWQADRATAAQRRSRLPWDTS